MTPNTLAALAAFVAARDDYDAKAARSKERWYDADARAKCHMALAALKQAEHALVTAYKAEQANHALSA